MDDLTLRNRYFSIFEACYWTISTPDYEYQTDGYVELQLLRADTADIYIYTGSDRRNFTSFIENNEKAILGAPFRVPISDKILIIAQTQYEGPVGSVSFSYQVFGEAYPVYEQPFLGLDIVWWYVALVGVALVPCLLVTVPGYCCCRHCKCCILCPCNKKRINRVIS